MVDCVDSVADRCGKMVRGITGSGCGAARRKRARKARTETEDTSCVATCAIVLRCVMHDGQAHNGLRDTLRALLTDIVSHVVKFIILDFPLPPVYPWAIRSLTNEMRFPHGRRPYAPVFPFSPVDVVWWAEPSR